MFFYVYVYNFYAHEYELHKQFLFIGNYKKALIITGFNFIFNNKLSLYSIKIKFINLYVSFFAYIIHYRTYLLIVVYFSVLLKD